MPTRCSRFGDLYGLVINYVIVLKGEERDSYGRLLYFYNRCDFKVSLITNF
jgi:hypothetical protein